VIGGSIPAPTIAEAALPGFDMTSWLSILAPAGTPRAVIDTLNSAAARVIGLPPHTQRSTSMSKANEISKCNLNIAPASTDPPF